MSDSNSLVYAVWTADLSECYRLSGMYCKSCVEINPNAREFPFDEGNRWDIRKVIQRELVGWSYLLVQGLSVTTGCSLALTCRCTQITSVGFYSALLSTFHSTNYVFRSSLST